ncbi:enoyl-CoA hydratase/isomerase family protein [Roseovarius indicus]|uniref:2,3-dehydroadipyl-CoA hydratase n=1 Tax=Roseovarius indicus TaxID=540747 RepID=A0A0T5PBW0_9RHOB|nr:enoyl-CoA hydratase/isomerase family protein [Roseovarius indicus]KRS18561.1 enoyl-CoA hydratase [Roseovarius indicus]QEW25569.1 2,3-dehydroadipyl-CoA hydratase [Roseovarius indicus]SFE02838.1 Enoyl-CoA hydratase/carnithine racemase [Roseovarius indicus]
MTDRLVDLEDRDGVRIITMNRPDKLNALNTALTQQLLTTLEDLASAPSVRAAVIRGEGRGFCAGADLSEFKDLTPDQSDRVLARADLTCRLQSVASQSPVPVVAAVHGATVGGGAGIALGCDMVVASRGLKLGYPETKHGIVPALVMTGLQRALGRKAAFEMISLGRLIDADEAKELGLVNRVVDGDPLPMAIEIANAWAEINPKAMAATKQLFYRVGELPFDAAMAAGRDTNALMRSFRTEEQ